jgi:hypothetical protein
MELTQPAIWQHEGWLIEMHQELGTTLPVEGPVYRLVKPGDWSMFL